jgi:3-phenylpropionate/trans-cinnamate dioxygenase ferredoxin subunit
MGRWVSIGPSDAPLGPSGMRVATVGEREIAVGRREDGRWVAFDDTCTHEECPLSDGELEGAWIVCYCHNSAFDLDTGAVVRGPAEDPIGVYPIREADGVLEIELDE